MKIIFFGNVTEDFSNFNPPRLYVNLYTNYLVILLLIPLDKYFPLKSKTITQKRVDVLWITSEIMKCIDKKHRWFKLLKQISLHRFGIDNISML